MKSLLAEAWSGMTGRRRGHGLPALLMLAVGFSALCCVGWTAYRLMWAPLPYEASEDLVQVRISLDGSAYQPELSGHEIDHLMQRSRTLGQVAGAWLRRTAVGNRTGTPQKQAEASTDVRLGVATWNLFDLLGAKPELGRGFQQSDAAENAEPAALLSHRLWTRRFGADPDLLGSSILINGRPMRVVGILDPSFRLLLPSTEASDEVEVWVANREELGREFHHRFSVLARLAEGVEPAQSQSELNSLTHGLDLTNAAYGTLPPRFRVQRLSSSLAAPYRRPLGLLAAAAVGLLLLISFNLAAQHLSQVQTFEREAAVRMALGASKARLAAAMTARAARLLIPAALAGLLLAWWMLEALQSLAPQLPTRLQTLSPGPEFVVLILAAVVWSACGYCIPLAARLSRLELAEGLKASSSRLFSGSRRLRHALVAAQIAGCMALLLGAGWLLQSFQGLLASDPGFRSQGVITFSASLPGSVYHSPELRSGFAGRMSRRLRAIPGVEASGAVSDLPLSGTSRQGVYAFPERPGEGQADIRYVVPGYFETMGIRLLRGRLFEQADLEQNLPLTVIDAGLARQGWPTTDPVGQRLLLPTADGDASWRTVIGVVENVRQGSLAELDGRQIYLSMSDRSVSRMFFVLRSPSVAGADWNGLIRRAVGEVDPRVGIASIRPMRDWVEDSASQTRFLAVLLGAFAGASCLLAALALYAALSSLTQERRGEIGLRMAVGARSADILRWVAARALVLTLTGTLLGLLFALLGWTFYGQLLYQSGPSDWLSWLYACGALLLLAASAASLPALRASRTDPAVVLRAL